MTQPSFLARKTFGWPNYFWIAMAFTLLVALIPRAAKEALDSNTNKAEDWLPSNYPESTDLRWFREHFHGEGFILVTWDGNTLGNQERLNLLTDKLSKRLQPVVRDGQVGIRGKVEHHTGKWYRKIISGPSMIKELTEPPLSIGYAEAVRRLEGALVGPPKTDSAGNQLDDSTRTTAIVLYLSPEGYESNRRMREVVDDITRLAVDECGIPLENLHMGGPIVDNVAIDRAGEESFGTLGSLSGLVGLAIAYYCFRNIKLTLAVVAVGAISAALSLAMVFYFGAFEKLVLGRATPIYGAMDAVLMSMPALVYVLGVSGAIHFVNYYRDVRASSGIKGAVEKAFSLAWIPCSLVALTTAVGFGSLVTSDIVPIRKFGGFSAAAIMASLGVLFMSLPVYLHRFPPAWIGRKRWEDISEDDDKLPAWAMSACRWITGHHALVAGSLMLVMALFAIGCFRLESSVQLIKLLDQDSDLVQDYIWVEKNMGYLVPLEVVVAVPPEQQRTGDEHAEADGQRYRMTFIERLGMVRRVLARIESLGSVSRTLSAATLAPDESQQTSAAARRAEDYTTNKNLEEHRRSFRDYLQTERIAGKSGPESRELWRVSARVTALKDIDYGHFTNELRKQVDPVLQTYRRRDELVRDLHANEKRLEGARLAILFRGALDDTQPAPDSPEGMLGSLLSESGVNDRVEGRKGSLVFFNVAQLENPNLSDEARAQIMKALGAQDAVLAVSPSLEQVAKSLSSNQVTTLNLTSPPAPEHRVIEPLVGVAGPHVVDALYTGIIPLVFKTQGELITSLQQSLFTSSLLILAVMAIVLRSLFAGAVSMLPNLFPVILVFGTLGLLGIKMDIGIIMTASVALGVAVDTTIHFVTWFFHGQSMGLDRRGSTMLAYERCGVAMVQGAMISGLGLAVFAFSSFTPTRQFGYLMITIQATALMGDLVFLPALLCGPLGKFFERFHERHLAKPGGDSDEGESATPASPWSDVDGQEAPIEPHAPQTETSRVGAAAIVASSTESSHDRTDRENGASHTSKPHVPATKDQSQLNSPEYNALRDKLRSFRRT